MDMTRYYVPEKGRRESAAERETKHKAATSRFTPKPSGTSLPTPQAFFEKQRQFKEADRLAMMRFAKKKVVKHNLKMRRKELKEEQERKIEEIRNKAHGITKRHTKPIHLERNIPEPENKEDVDEYNGAEFNKLSNALRENNEYEINRSVLVNFFEMKDPDRVSEVDELLRMHVGQEAELFDEISRVYKVIRENGRTRARNATIQNYRKSRNVSVESRGPTYSFVEGNVDDAPSAAEQNGRSSARVASLSRMKRGLKKIPSNLSMDAAKSVISIESALSVSSKVEGVKEFQKALDKEIKQKKHRGEYVTKMKERGGQWWVNRSPPKVHPSMRRRNTLLDELRKGTVPISDL